MPHFLIPLLIAGVILVPLGVLLWLGARERRQFSPARDGELGELKLFKNHWEAAVPMELGQDPVSVSGVGKGGGPTPLQKVTLGFVRGNAVELIESAIEAGKGAIVAAESGCQPNDLRVTGVFLERDLNCFELLLESKSCEAIIPDGVTVSFTGRQIDETEIVH